MKPIPQLLAEIDAMKAAQDAVRPLPPHTVASLRDKLTLEWTCHSNGIEGNTLTLRETQVVLEGITVGGKSLREHLEAINHRDAISDLEQLVADQDALSEWQILSLHRLVLKGIDDAEAGQYRHENVAITGASTTPPMFLQTPDEMGRLVDWYQHAPACHPALRAAELHARFERVHPFVDGNGRTGRLLMNFELMKAGYPPAVLHKENRAAYYEALDAASISGDYAGITWLVAEAEERSISAYLALIAPV